MRALRLFCGLAITACVVGCGGAGGNGGGSGNTIINQPGPDEVDLDLGDEHDFIISSVQFTTTMITAGDGTITAKNVNQVDDMLVRVIDSDTREQIIPDPLVTPFDEVLLAPNGTVTSNTVTLGNGRRLIFEVQNVGTNSSPPACSRTSSASCLTTKILRVN